MWQGRYFGRNPRHPKYFTRGNYESVLDIIGQPLGKNIILTEDLISAIKVGRKHTTMPLWGSYLSTSNAKRLSVLFSEAFLWLDYDKREEAVKLSLKHCLHLDIIPIITHLDPKCYTDGEIGAALHHGV